MGKNVASALREELHYGKVFRT